MMIISGERRISYPEIQERIARAASGFRALGVSRWCACGADAANDFAFFEASVAAAMLGSPVVPINWHLADEVAYILADSGAQALVCHADLLPQIKEGLPKRLPFLVVETPPRLPARSVCRLNSRACPMAM
jgi:long-chain acyl-CoA synthetase